MHYKIMLFMPYTAEQAGTIIVTTEEQMVQEVRDAIHDGLGVYVCAYEPKTPATLPKGLTNG